MNLHLFRYTDSESFWISAVSAADAAAVYAENYDPIEDLSKISAIPDEESVKIRDGATSETKTAGQWAASGRGIIGATCE